MAQATRVFGYTDIHFPDHDPVALAVAEKAQRSFAPDITVIGGDLLNCTPFTRFADRKMTKPYNFDEQELVPANKFLDRVQAHTKQQTVFLEGNHDEWLERWCSNSGKAAASLHDMVSVKRHLSAGRTNFRYIPYTVESGRRQGVLHLHSRLSVVHGWTACKHAASKHLDLARSRSIIYHHTHRIQSHVARDPWSGRVIEAFSAGCLCKLQPLYAHGGSPTEWAHGFWIAYIGKSSYTAYTVKIERGICILPDGTEIRA